MDDDKSESYKVILGGKQFDIAKIDGIKRSSVKPKYTLVMVKDPGPCTVLIKETFEKVQRQLIEQLQASV